MHAAPATLECWVEEADPDADNYCYFLSPDQAHDQVLRLADDFVMPSTPKDQHLVGQEVGLPADICYFD